MAAMLTLASYLAENARPVHERIAAWVGRRVGEPAALLAAPWEERLRWLDDGRVHVGFLCGWPYSQRVDRPGSVIELCCAPVMAAPRYRDRPIYFTDVIVAARSPFRSFADLRGRAYAYNDPDSHSGYNVPRDHLLRLGETAGYFGRVVASGSHQASIRLVGRALMGGRKEVLDYSPGGSNLLSEPERVYGFYVRRIDSEALFQFPACGLPVVLYGK